MVEQTAAFAADFLTYDDKERPLYHQRRHSCTGDPARCRQVNPPFELAYWYYAPTSHNNGASGSDNPAMRSGTRCCTNSHRWPRTSKGLYLAAENAVDTYRDIRYTSDHMACLMACGMLPMSPLVKPSYMRKTFDWVYDN